MIPFSRPAVVKEDLGSYVEAARFIRRRGYDFLFVQHEFGIFGPTEAEGEERTREGGGNKSPSSAFSYFRPHGSGWQGPHMGRGGC